jgi:DNA ligase D-like protein (predicted 3'-phosphoesterase)
MARRSAGLKDYAAKRDFKRTPEPSGAKAKGGRNGRARKPLFVIQEHAARNLHYDFRLEVDGVLASWAVPKGPSLDPRDKRLAVRTEDHPLDYADFEGNIPPGEYGAGAVIVWDTGPYRNLMGEKDKPLTMRQAIDKGHVEVWLEGEKLQGGFALVRMKPRRGEKRENWLLIKMDDEAADRRRRPVSTQTRSVLSGRTVDEVGAEGADA